MAKNSETNSLRKSAAFLPKKSLSLPIPPLYLADEVQFPTAPICIVFCALSVLGTSRHSTPWPISASVHGMC